MVDVAEMIPLEPGVVSFNALKGIADFLNLRVIGYRKDAKQCIH